VKAIGSADNAARGVPDYLTLFKRAFPRAAREGTSAGLLRAGFQSMPRIPCRHLPAYFPPSQPCADGIIDYYL